MSKIIYYIGAGASYGNKNKRELLDEGTEDERLLVHEGLPVVNEIAKSLVAFQESVRNVDIIASKFYTFMDKYKTIGTDVNCIRSRLLEDIKELHKAAKEHSTIDTYAKKLYLTKQVRQLEKLKNVLATFFIWIQLESKTDQRYDTFLANILQMDNLSLPLNISVISWNYDSQFELAYKNYSNNNLPIYDKLGENSMQNNQNSGVIFKLNGSANFGDFNMVDYILNHRERDVHPLVQLIEYYGHLEADTTELGFDFHSHLSFAWESTKRQKEMITTINQITSDTEAVVVIGYSFPYFNREIDRAIFSKVPTLKTIYIQDPNPESVEPSLRAVLDENRNVKIEYQKDCTQFYLPREL